MIRSLCYTHLERIGFRDCGMYSAMNPWIGGYVGVHELARSCSKLRKERAHGGELGTYLARISRRVLIARGRN